MNTMVLRSKISVNRFSSARIAAVAVLTLVAVPAVGVGSTAEAAPTARAAAAGEPRCTEGESWKGGGWGQYADVWACMKTDGRMLDITAHAACYYALGTYEQCSATGRWTLRKDGKDVASSISGAEVVYPGPGTYELDMYIEARGRSASSSSDNLQVSGHHVRTVTFDTPLIDGPLLDGAASPSVYDPSALTVTNKGNQPAKAVVIKLEGSDITKVTNDKRCKPNDWGDLECALGDVAPKSSVSVPLERDALDDICMSDRGFTFWTYKAENFPESAGKSLCRD
ncbi:hypothetical protein [Streptomyces sp. NPDC026659]|uniref:hypothetical protein n=1 Tax=Streptomyces sp. NPDC026659 TaxID=3155123 RepID=UPI0033FDCBFF